MNYQTNGKSPLRHYGNTALFIVGLVFTLIGVPMLAAGMIVWQFLRDQLPADDHLALSIVFCVLGAVFFLVGLGLLIGYMTKRNRMQKLMREGACYEAEVVNAYYSSMNVNYRPGVILECRYVDSQGASHLVKSGALWRVGLMRRPEDYHARVWVDRYDSKKYFVEVLDAAAAGAVDYDDR